MAVAHYLSIVIISIASFVFGLIPLTFKKFSTQSCSFFLSLILCLGAGVLLATSIVHMLTEVQEKLKSNAQLYFCLGFLILYFFDEISHFIVQSRKKKIINVSTP